MQIIIVACALLGVALGQYGAYPGYAGWAGYNNRAYPGYAGYTGYPGYAGYQGYQGYQGYPGYAGYQGYPGYPGYRGYPQLLTPVKPADPKDKDVPAVIKAIEAPVIAPVLPVLEPGVVPPGVYGGPGIAIRSQVQQDSAPDGSYSFSYETDNGISVAESGGARFGPEGREEAKAGQYSYTAPDGTPILVRWTADKDGFHPEGYNFARLGYAYGRGLPVPVPVAPIAKRENKPEESDSKQE